MLEAYLQSATSQLIERASGLKGKLPRPPIQAFASLAGDCCRRIDRAVEELKALRDHPDLKKPEKAAARLREFRRVASNMDRIENEGIAAIVRSGKEEPAMIRLLDRMSQEIVYPIELPTVSMLSQNYFFIRTDFQLMCIPLMEPHFLLHLPDIYHELAHPLFRTKNDPRTEAWRNAFLLASGMVYDHLRKQIGALESARAPDSHKALLQLASDNWIHRWMEEIFCDLFALFSVGPAFAWAHLHLHAERGGNAFQLPQRRSTHPADSPRMSALLEGLDLLEERSVAAEIESKWQGLLGIAGQVEPPDFHRYYPQRLIQRCVRVAFDGFERMGCRPWPGSEDDGVRILLNEAWSRFWNQPANFVTWERDATRILLTQN